MVVNDPNVGLAFALCAGAGAARLRLELSVVFFPSLVKLASRRVLAGVLGLSAGVMTYVSFVEIFQKSLVSFGEAGCNSNIAYCCATVCFFGGAMFVMLLDVIVKCLSGHHDHEHELEPEEDYENKSCTSQVIMESHCVYSSNDAVRKLDELQRIAERVHHKQEELNTVTTEQFECHGCNEKIVTKVIRSEDSNIM